MEDNEVQEVEVETSDEELEAFDESWADDEDEEVDDGDEGSEVVDEPISDDEPDQEEAGNPETDHDEEQPQDSEEQSEEPGAETEEGNQFLEIDYLGNKEQLTREQAKELAQKGRNYDHVVEERDRLRGEAGKYNKFLEELAERAGLSIDEQIDRTRAMWLMNDEFDKGNEISEADALLQVQRAKNTPAPKEEDKPEENATNTMIDRFLAIYPDVKATEIPKEVWDAAKQTGDLLGSYQAFEIKRLKAENEKAKQDARNERNAQRSTGPRKSSGSRKVLDDFDAGWNSDD